MTLRPPQPLAEHHSTSGFDGGDPSLNQWLHQRAWANQRSGATRTVVVHAASDEAREFSLHTGFDASPADPFFMLLLRLADAVRNPTCVATSMPRSG